MSESISSRAPKPVGAYPHAKRVGNLLFLSGIGPRDPATNGIPGNKYDAAGKLVSYDIAAQCKSVFDNVRIACHFVGRQRPLAARQEIVSLAQAVSRTRRRRDRGPA